MKTCCSSPFHALNFKITYENTEHFGISRETWLKNKCGSPRKAVSEVWSWLNKSKDRFHINFQSLNFMFRHLESKMKIPLGTRCCRSSGRASGVLMCWKSNPLQRRFAPSVRCTYCFTWKQLLSENLTYWSTQHLCNKQTIICGWSEL